MKEPREQKLTLSMEALTSKDFDPKLWQEMSFNDYLKFAQGQPSVCFSAYQRLYQAIMGWGVEKRKFARREFTHHKFFDDPMNNGVDAIFGLERHTDQLVKLISAGAARMGPERRIILLHGPVGSSKSTMARLIRSGLEYHTRTDEGKLYTYVWVPEDDHDRELMGLLNTHENEKRCPYNDDPMKLLPPDVLTMVTGRLNEGNEDIQKNILFEGELCPLCRFIYRGLLKKHKDKGDQAWKTILEKHIRVQRLVFSEVDRIGLGSFRPKDEKNQDSTELSGDINYRKIAEYGSESDPRAFSADGEFQISNRGVFYTEEMLKFAQAFLYDYLGATQEHKIKPKRQAESDIDEVLIGGTNDPEYQKLCDNDTMEAFQDRTITVDVPYLLNYEEEKNIYLKNYGPNVSKDRPAGHKHIAPHVVEMMSLWSVLTRQEGAGDLTPVDKARLFAGKAISGFSPEKFQELVDESDGEGMSGISPRYNQDKIGSAMVDDIDSVCVDWFLVSKKLETGLKKNSVLKDSEKDSFGNLFSEVGEEYDAIIESEVQQAIATDESGLKILFNNYITSVKAFVNEEKIRNRHTKEMVPPDEGLMQEIEKHMGIEAQARPNHRHKLMAAIGTRAVNKEEFDYKSDEKLYKGLQLKLFNDRKDTINLATWVSGTPTPEEQEKIDIVHSRLIHQFGYCKSCAENVLSRVASIFAQRKRDK